MPQHKNKFGSYFIDPFPSCGELGISHGAWIEPRYRGKGLGQLQHKERLIEAAEQFYTALVATVREDNDVEKHILGKNGWSMVWTFQNKDGENTQLWVRKIDPPSAPWQPVSQRG